jgi:uncharacterized membrane protein YqjE
MTPATSSGEMDALDLVQRAVSDARELIRLEVALAKDELQTDLTEAKSAILYAGVAVVLALSGLASLVVAFGLALGPIAALALAAVLLVVAATLGRAAFRRLPKKPLRSTLQRLKADESMIAEHAS